MPRRLWCIVVEPKKAHRSSYNVKIILEMKPNSTWARDVLM